MNAASPHILVIEDDADTRLNLTDILELDGYDVATAATAAEAMNRSNWAEISAIILDRKLPDGNALQILPRLRELAPQASVMVVTGFADLDGAISALRYGAEDYLLKPINPDLLRTSLARIAERQRARQEILRLNTDLQRRVTELQTLLDVIPIGIAIAHDPQCRSMSANPPLAKAMGIAPGVNPSLSASPEIRPHLKVLREGRELAPEELPMQVAAAQGVDVRDVEIELLRADGEVVYLLGNAAPLLDESGAPRGAVGAFVDITERKRTHERQLQRERLAAIGETMTGLVHESRNALQRSKACLEMLALEVEDRPEALRLLTRVQQAQEDLHRLYEEVREYAAPINLNREVCDLSQICREMWGHLSHLHESKQLRLKVELRLADCQCQVDRFAVGQVVRNILENAMAVSPEAGIIAVCAQETRFSGKPAVAISFADQGPGLTAEQRQRIFEPFFTTKAKGTGLGMAIAQRIVQSHGGQIHLGPSDRQGAEIVVVLPRKLS